jgi:hypothetical protein
MRTRGQGEGETRRGGDKARSETEMGIEGIDEIEGNDTEVFKVEANRMTFESRRLF